MAREGGDAEAEQARRHAVCLVAAFAHTMKFHLTVDGVAHSSRGGVVSRISIIGRLSVTNDS